MSIKITNKDFLELLKGKYFYKAYCGKHSVAEIEQAYKDKWQKIKPKQCLWYVGNIKNYKALTHCLEHWDITSTLDLKHARVELLHENVYLVKWFETLTSENYYASCLYIIEREW